LEASFSVPPADVPPPAPLEPPEEDDSLASLPPLEPSSEDGASPLVLDFEVEVPVVDVV
jgi:hypothetical protein